MNFWNILGIVLALVPIIGLFIYAFYLYKEEWKDICLAWAGLLGILAFIMLVAFLITYNG